MKKIIAIMLAAFGLATYAAYDCYETSTIDVFAPTSITGATTNTTEFAFSGGVGRAAVCITATPANGRLVFARLSGRNATTETWRIQAEQTFTATNAVVVRLPFVSEYAPATLKLEVSPAVSVTASAFVETNRK